MNLDTKTPSQSDCVARIALRKTNCTRAEEILRTKLSDEQIPARPQLKGGSANLLTDLALITAHEIKLNELVSMNPETARIDRISKSSTGAGVPDPQTTGASAIATAPGAQWNPDALILAARGATTHTELSAMQLPPPDFDTAPSTEAQPTHSANAPGAKAKLPSAADGIGHPGHVPGYDPDKAIFEARGVSSLEELNTKYRDGNRIA